MEKTLASRKHNREYFFKYMSLDTAMKVVENHSFRWSCPLNFNDPFDHQAGFSFPFTPEEFATAIANQVVRLALDPNVVLKEPTAFGRLAVMLGQIRPKLTREELFSKFAVPVQEIAAGFPKIASDFVKTIQAHLLHSRVFCVTEKHDNVVMWSHYANEHKGVVLRLRCIDEHDNTLLAARKVTYSRDFVRFPNAEEYARHATGEKPIDLLNLAWEICYRKHDDWKYEQEWRVHLPLLNEPAGDGFSYEKEHPEVFDEAYLGCRMNNDDVVKIAACIKRHLPHVKIFQALKSPTSFNLEFVPLDLM